jgi:5-methylthioribose kinase
MHLLTPENAFDYLRSHGHVADSATAEVQWLAWGVSNVVLLVTPAGAPAFVVKQSREQLRTKADWFSRLDRVWREIDAMRTLEPLLPAEGVPRVLFEDRANYLFGMEAVDPRHVVWKGELLAGRTDVAVATAAAELLAGIHRETAGRDDLQRAFGDREVFDQLRLDPFYRRVAAVHPDLEPQFDRLIAETLSRSDCLVHADFSPKNLLVVREPSDAAGAVPVVTLVDYETAHYGDPAFDLGFFLSHLLLKAVVHGGRADVLGLARGFWKRYRAALGSAGDRPAFATGELDRRTIGHLAGCMLARIDGKSTVDYLPEIERQERVRRYARGLLLSPPASLDDAFDQLGRR